MEWVLLPTPERKKFGKTDDYRLLNQNILFQSHVFKTWEPKIPLPSIFCLVKVSTSHNCLGLFQHYPVENQPVSNDE
jgi:hypothetical protein